MLRTAYIAWILVCLVWGTTYLAIRVALETIPPALVGGIRYVVGGALLALFVRARGRVLPPRSQWPGLTLLGLLMFGLGNGGVIWAEQWVPSGIAAVVVASSPFWMTGIETLLPDGERLPTRVVLGLVVGFAGILLLVWPDLTAGGERGRNFGAGVIALQIACIGWAAGSSYGKRHVRHDDPIGSSSLQMLFGGLILMAIATLRGEWTDLAFSTRSLLAEIYLTVVGGIVGFTAYVYALKHLPISTVAMYAYVNPFIAVLLGTLLLDEAFGVRIVIAAALVLGGVAVVRSAGPRLRT